VADALVIETTELRKNYDGVEALRGLNLQVPSGSIYGFLGRNGAGKTTAIKILLGMTHATSGQARVFGLSPADPRAALDVRGRTGFVGEEKELYAYMSVADMIRFTAAFYPRWRRDLEQRYVRAFALPLGRRVKRLSLGMRTKLALLLALCRGAELLVLDEPTSGLDPAATEEMLQALVSHVAAENLTIFFSSHQLAEVDQIADHIAIIHAGRTVVTGALDDLRENFRRVQLVFDGEAPDARFRAPCVQSVQRKGRVLIVLSNAGAEPVLEEARALYPSSMDVAPVTLKEIFLEAVAAED
jgi:ABC-2 type transport system ATP-binding protein